MRWAVVLDLRFSMGMVHECFPRPTVVMYIWMERNACEKTTVNRMAQSSHQWTNVDATVRDQKRKATATVGKAIPNPATATIEGPRSAAAAIGSMSFMMAESVVRLAERTDNLGYFRWSEEQNKLRREGGTSA